MRYLHALQAQNVGLQAASLGKWADDVDESVN
jgi:hypothetical protein